VRFTRSANGGDETAQFTRDRPGPAGLLAPDSRVVISTPDGQVQWTGRIGIPGDEWNGGDRGPSDVGCVGSVSELAGSLRSAPYLVRGTDKWRRAWRVASRNIWTTESSRRPNVDTDLDGLLITAPPGTVTTNDRAVMSFMTFEDTGFKVGGVGFGLLSGQTNTDWRSRVWVGGETGTAAYSATASTTYAGVSFAMDGTAGKPFGQSKLSVDWQFTGSSTTTSNENLWTIFEDVRVLAEMWLRDGTTRRTPGTTQYLYASEVVEDVVGRWLGSVIDPLLADITTGTVQIDTLDYTDGVTIRDLFDDLVAFQPGWRWRMGTMDPTSWRAPLTVGPWPSVTRYVVPSVPGVTASEPGSESDLCDRVTVFWADPLGRRRWVTRVADRTLYPDLAGLPASGRAAPPVTLDGPTASAANAVAVADALLATVAKRPDAATVTIAPSVLVIDMVSGAAIPADEMEPGEVVGVQALGRSVPCTEVSVDEGTTTLALGKPMRTTDQLVTDALRRSNRRR
jgi:hypothetical protein